MVATLALAPHSRPRIDSGIFLVVLAVVAAVIMGLLLMHVVAMPTGGGMGHDEAGAAMATSDTTASMQTSADHGAHAGGTCISSSPQAVAVVVPPDSVDLMPAVTQPPVIRPDPAGEAPGLFSLCVQRR